MRSNGLSLQVTWIDRGCRRVFMSLAPNNSFKPTPHRGVNSVLCATLHAVAAPLRDGLTQALGGRKRLIALLFNILTLPASIGVALRSVSCRFASSGKSVWRAHTSHALRWSASETVIGRGQFPVTHTVASVTSSGLFTGARPGLPASTFGKCARVRRSSASTAT